VAVHAQPAVAVTAIVPLPPPATADWKSGVASYEQAAPACVTGNGCPPIVSVPVRVVPVVFAATLNVTVPLPEPDPPPVIVSQVALLVAVHVQPARAVTPTDPVLAPTGTD